MSYGILMSLTAVLQFVSGIFSVDLFNYTALKQITRIRNRFFQSLIRQDVGWYDVSTGNNFAVRITEYVCIGLIKKDRGETKQPDNILYIIIIIIIMSHSNKFVPFSKNTHARTTNRDIDKIREGIAEKVSHFLWLIMGFIICVSLSFYYGWELSLVVISYVPIVIVTNTIIGKVRLLPKYNVNAESK